MTARGTDLRKRFIGNEILDAGKPLGASIGRDLADKVRALDPTRFLTNGISGFVATLSDTPW
jgi:beta-galactosidase